MMGLVSSFIISKPGNERQLAMAISQLFPNLNALACAENSQNMITKTVLKFENRVEFMKIRGYVLIKSAANASAQAST